MTTSNDPDEIRTDIERTRAALSDDVDDLAESVKPKNVAGRQVGKVKEAASNLKERVMGSDDDDDSTGAVGIVSDKTSSAKDAVADGAYAAKGAVADKASATKDTVSERASEAREAVRQAPRRMKRRAQGNPLAAGVVAFGLGMLVSSLIPSSEKEREAVSQLQQNLEPVKEKATEVARDVGESLKPAAQEAAQSVKTTAQEGVQAVRQEGQSAAQDVKDQAQESKDTVQQQRS
jgi:gas vesicle protein